MADGLVKFKLLFDNEEEVQEMAQRITYTLDPGQELWAVAELSGVSFLITPSMVDILKKADVPIQILGEGYVPQEDDLPLHRMFSATDLVRRAAN